MAINIDQFKRWKKNASEMKGKFFLSFKEKRGILTWPNQDDQIKMTEIGEHDRKIHNNEC